MKLLAGEAKPAKTEIPVSSGRHPARIVIALIVIVGVLAGAGYVYIHKDEILTNPNTHVSHVMYPLKYTEEIADSAARHQVNPYWICAMIRAESNWDESAVSSAGAIGLMQVRPETAQDMADLGIVDAEAYPVENLADPVVNIEYGTAYLRYLVERYHEMEPAICAYNAGLGNVDVWLEEDGDVRESVAFEETDQYLLRVESYKAIYEEMYPDAFD